MKVDGMITPPGDKSITHRALMLAALARGPSVIHDPLGSADTRTTAGIMRRLGATISRLRDGQGVRVLGRRWRVPSETLHCGNSGTTARIVLGLLAAHPFTSRLSGDRSLRHRPMRRVTEPLSEMGAQITEETGDGLPLTIHGGKLRRIRYQTPVASAQIKSALLFAGLFGGVGVSVTEPHRSRDHTERFLRYLGAKIRVSGTTVSIPASEFRPEGFEVTIPGDPSSAAFFVALAVLADEGELIVRDVGLNPTRAGFLRVLERMGGKVRIENPRELAGEPVADLVARASRLRATVVHATEVPSLIDEIPVLAIVAARSAGVTEFRGVGELRVKESDRLALIASNLTRLGYEVAVSEDTLAVQGDPEHAPIGRVVTANDHRLAMAFGVLAKTTGARIALSERSSAGVSYPGFFSVLRGVVRP